MSEISLDDFRASLDGHLKDLDLGEREIVVTREGAPSVVLVSSREWESMKETLHLLGAPVNRRHLVDSVAEANRGEVEEHDLIRS